MPEYLAPGVYIEETSFRSKSIEGVSTTTTGFIGPTRFGPIDLEPDIVTSLGEYERTYGDGQPLVFGDAGTVPNYMWHAARAFFEEGGKRLYVARTFLAGDDDDGVARATLAADGEPVTMTVRARFPGNQGRGQVRIAVKWGPNILGKSGVKPTLGALGEGDIVWMSPGTKLETIAEPPIGTTVAPEGVLFRANRVQNPAPGAQPWQFSSSTIANNVLADDQDDGIEIRVVTLTLTIAPPLVPGGSMAWDGLSFASGHVGASGLRDGITDLFAAAPASAALARTVPIVVELAGTTAALGGLDVADLIVARLPAGNAFTSPATPDFSETKNSLELLLDDGNDGQRPDVDAYQGEAPDDSTTKTGLKAFEDLEDISIVAAPGYSHFNDQMAQAVQGLLLSHADAMRYRIAVLDAGRGFSISEVRQQRGKIDSTYGALYYPWVKVMDPISREPIDLPPSGFVAGIYARNDIERAVYKAPANEVVNLAIGFEQLLNKSQQDVLNPEGVNCFRYFEGRGYRLWGARTVSSDPEWKYVNLRRYFAYLERSIDRGTQWVVFEPNGERLWANVRRTIEDFLFNEWQNGALLGDKPERAYFVKCDRSTMTQNDLDNGRLVCQVGVAALRPAEFVIFRIGQWTGDRRS